MVHRHTREPPAACPTRVTTVTRVGDGNPHKEPRASIGVAQVASTARQAAGDGAPGYKRHRRGADDAQPPDRRRCRAAAAACPRHHRQRRWPATVSRDTRRRRHGRSWSETSALPVGAGAERQQQKQQHAQAPPTAGDEKTTRTHRAALAARRNAAHWQRHRAQNGAGASAVGATDVGYGRRQLSGTRP